MQNRNQSAQSMCEGTLLARVLPVPLSFEKVSSAHCHILAALHQKSFKFPWTAVEFRQLLEHPGTHGQIALNAHLGPLGFIVLRKCVDEAEILTFCVEVQHRNQKIATRIFNSVLSQYINGSINRVFLEVAEDNLAAIGLYQNCGFKNAGQRPGYYCTQGATAKKAIIMALTL